MRDVREHVAVARCQIRKRQSAHESHMGLWWVLWVLVACVNLMSFLNPMNLIWVPQLRTSLMNFMWVVYMWVLWVLVVCGSLYIGISICLPEFYVYIYIYIYINVRLTICCARALAFCSLATHSVRLCCVGRKLRAVYFLLCGPPGLF